MIKTVIAINSHIPKLSKMSKPKDLLSELEIAKLDESILEGKNREQLLTLQKKLEDTFEWLGVGNNHMDDQALRIWESNIQRLECLIERIDDMLEETENPTDEPMEEN